MIIYCLALFFLFLHSNCIYRFCTCIGVDGYITVILSNHDWHQQWARYLIKLVHFTPRSSDLKFVRCYIVRTLQIGLSSLIRKEYLVTRPLPLVTRPQEHDRSMVDQNLWILSPQNPLSFIVWGYYLGIMYLYGIKYQSREKERYLVIWS